MKRKWTAALAVLMTAVLCFSSAMMFRYIRVYAVYEFEDGEVYLTEFYAVQNYNGSGYDDKIVVNYSSRYGDVKYSIEKWEAKTDIFTSKIGGAK